MTTEKPWKGQRRKPDNAVRDVRDTALDTRQTGPSSRRWNSTFHTYEMSWHPSVSAAALMSRGVTYPVE